MAEETLRVRGYRELLAACDRAGKDSKREVRATLRAVGEIVRSEAEALFDPYNARSARGYRVRVRARGIAVEQSLRRTTGKHPEYGALQMNKALLPARARKGEEIDAAFEVALDRVADRFEA